MSGCNSNRSGETGCPAVTNRSGEIGCPDVTLTNGVPRNFVRGGGRFNKYS